MTGDVNVIEFLSLTVRGPRGDADMSARDLDVLGYLAEAGGRAVTRHDLLRDVWGFPEPERLDTRVVDVRIARARRVLETLYGYAPIGTVRGVGYRLRESPQPEGLLDVEVVLLPRGTVMVLLGSMGLMLAWAMEYRRARLADTESEVASEVAPEPEPTTEAAPPEVAEVLPPSGIHFL